jgi:hypothetical protein
MTIGYSTVSCDAGDSPGCAEALADGAAVDADGSGEEAESFLPAHPASNMRTIVAIRNVWTENLFFPGILRKTILFY